MKDTPMGVSQWREYGKKHGYWKYFEKEARKEAEKQTAFIILLEMASALTVAPQFGVNKAEMPKVIGLKIDELRKRYDLEDGKEEGGGE